MPLPSFFLRRPWPQATRLRRVLEGAGPVYGLSSLRLLSPPHPPGGIPACFWRMTVLCFCCASAHASAPRTHTLFLYLCIIHVYTICMYLFMYVCVCVCVCVCVYRDNRPRGAEGSHLLCHNWRQSWSTYNRCVCVCLERRHTLKAGVSQKNLTSRNLHHHLVMIQFVSWPWKTWV